MKQKNKVPKDWVESKLIQCVDINKENLSDKNDKNIKFYYIDLSSVDKGTINLPLNKIDFINAPVRARRIINKDDILFSTVRPYLKGFAYISFETNKEWIVSTGFAVLTAKKNIISKYIYQYLFLDKFLKQIETCLLGSSYPALNSSDIENLIITYPIGVKEQEKIVEILELWDKAIETTKKLIEQKKLQKKYLMQKLLTGKIRLKGFNDKWKNNLLQDLLFEENKRNHKNLVEKVFSITKSRGFVESSEYFSKEVASKDISNYKIVNFGNFAYNPARLNIGSIAKLKINDKVVVSPMYVVFSINTKLLNSNWFEFFIGTYEFNKKVNLSSQGSVRKTVDFSIFKKNKILLPTIKEQKAIADILLTVDKQIDLLEQKLSNLELQKKGLMQKLLTGEIRVC